MTRNVRCFSNSVQSRSLLSVIWPLCALPFTVWLQMKRLSEAPSPTAVSSSQFLLSDCRAERKQLREAKELGRGDRKSGGWREGWVSDLLIMGSFLKGARRHKKSTDSSCHQPCCAYGLYKMAHYRYVLCILSLVKANKPVLKRGIHGQKAPSLSLFTSNFLNLIYKLPWAPKGCVHCRCIVKCLFLQRQPGSFVS